VCGRRARGISVREGADVPKAISLLGLPDRSSTDGTSSGSPDQGVLFLESLNKICVRLANKEKVRVLRSVAEALVNSQGTRAAASPSTGPQEELRVEDIAADLGRSPSTVREWLRTGELRGYKFRDREWRIPWDSYEEFKARMMGLGGWKHERRRDAALDRDSV